MEIIEYPTIEETLAVLQSRVDQGMGLYPAATPTEEIEPRPPSGNMHDKITGEPLTEAVIAVTDDPQYAVFKAAYGEQFNADKAARGYEPGALGMSIRWKDHDPRDPEFHGFDYGATDELKLHVTQAAAAGKIAVVGFLPKDGFTRREGVPDWATQGRAIRPAGWIAVTGAHFLGEVGPYVSYDATRRS